MEVLDQMTGMENDFIGAMERRRNCVGLQSRSWTPHYIRTGQNNDTTDDDKSLHRILNTSSYKNNMKIEDNISIEQYVPFSATSLSNDIMQLPFSESTSLYRDSKASSNADIALDGKLVTETNNVLSVMQIPTAASFLDTELVTNEFHITEEAQPLISSPSDLCRFCEEIESHVINFVSKDMLELNHLITGTELELSGSNEIEIDKETAIEDSFSPRSSSESSMKSSSDINVPFGLLENQPEISSSSEDSVDESLYICEMKQDYPIFAEVDYDNGKISNSITVPVATMSEQKGAKRKWDKTFLCIFCEKLFTKLPRHWYMKHPNEKEVINIMSLSSHSKEKKKLIAELQNKGVALINTNVIKTGEGSVVPKRRPRPGVKTNVEDYICCRYCNQLFLKTYIEKHERKRCSFNVKSKEMNKL